MNRFCFVDIEKTKSKLAHGEDTLPLRLNALPEQPPGSLFPVLSSR